MLNKSKIKRLFNYLIRILDFFYEKVGLQCSISIKTEHAGTITMIIPAYTICE